MLHLLLQLGTRLGTARTAACFLHERCSTFTHNNSISLTNQLAAFCLLSLRGVGRIWLLPSVPAPQRWESVWKGFLLQNPNFYVWVFLTVLFVFAFERPQIVWPSCLSWWLLDFLWANSQFSLFHHIVPGVYHRPQATFELWGALRAEMLVVACCRGWFWMLPLLFHSTSRPAAVSWYEIIPDSRWIMEQRQQIVQLFFQMNTAGPVEYSVEVKGLTPRFGPQYLRKLIDKIFSPCWLVHIFLGKSLRGVNWNIGLSRRRKLRCSDATLHWKCMKFLGKCLQNDLL